MFQSLYYTLKPLIPRRLQISLRRALVQNKRKKYAHVWPIDERAGKPPDGWTGWPEGKKFALVLTHDVESAKGVPRCLPLADLEERLGFRSSFNFVAEDYFTPPTLLDNLRNRGFEIGLHGLTHDGNLFRSEKFFHKKVDRINRYLKELGASGFRSPSMYRNLEWIGDLNIEYDASTFDTDPFEPQPDGVSTIFPFMARQGGTARSFIELPYTLPQDFLLFVIMREKGIDIWKQKLDWIAERGGMVLLNVHPNYINFDGSKCCRYDEYPARIYGELLQYSKAKYNDQYWNPPPNEIARFWMKNYANETLRITSKKRVCMLAYSMYDTDNRVKRYAETLVKRGDEVDVIALRRDSRSKMNLGGVTVFRIQERVANEKNQLNYLWRLVKFFVKSTFVLAEHHLKKPYDIIHVHNIPDFLVFASIIPKILGAKVILDIHDIVPELYTSKFGGNDKSIMFKALVAIEKASCSYSDQVIISNHLWEKTLLLRSVQNGKCCVIMNYPDSRLFRIKKIEKDRDNDKFIIVYPGTLNWHQGLDIAINALAKVSKETKNVEFHIYGDGPNKKELIELVRELRLEDKVLFMGIKPIEEMAEIMPRADIGIVPKRNNSFGGSAFSTKILEFMAFGIPVIVSRTKIDEYYFNDLVVQFFKPEDVDDLAICILELKNSCDKRETLRRNASEYIKNYTWDKHKDKYLNLVDTLTSN